MKRHLLFVDDQPQVLSALQRMLHAYRNEWEMTFVGSGEEALAHLARSTCDVVVTDMKMPGTDGAELLQQVQQRHPQTVRIVLSGQADLLEIERSVNTAHQYLAKPCDAEALRATVARACGLHGRLADESLRKVISAITTLPSLPTVYAELVKELQSNDASLERVAELISRDVAMTAKLQQLLSSSFFGPPRQAATPLAAASYLGLNVLRPIVLSAGVFAAFSDCSLRGYSIAFLTEHSLLVSRVAEQVAKDLGAGTQMTSDAMLAGLVHDVGQLVPASNLTSRFQAALDFSRQRQVPLYMAERELIGADHANVGAYLLGLWGLPNTVVEAVAYHHEPSQCPGASIAPLTAVHVANVLVNQQSEAAPFTLSRELDSAHLKLVGVGSERLPAWTALVEDMVSKECLA